MTIKPTKLFSPEILKFQVKTKKLGIVNYVNLDNAATTPPFLNVEKKAKEYLASYGSVHRGAGTKSKISTDIYEKTRETIKKFVGADPDDYVIFTGNTTGAMNTAAYFFSFLEGKVAVSEIEHSSSWLPWIKEEGIKKLGQKQTKITSLPKTNFQIQHLGAKQVLRYQVNNNFEFDLPAIEKILKNNKIKAFVLTASSNVTGYCPDIQKIGRLVHKYGAYYIVDACQYIQHHEIKIKKMGIDFLAASGHKFYAPYGGGFLIGPKKFLDKFLPYQIGGGNLPYITNAGEFLRYENQLAHDPGTPNALGAITMSAAIEELEKIGLQNIEKHEKSLALTAFRKLKRMKKVELYVTEKHLNTVIPFGIKGLNPNEIAERLNNDFGIGVRAGSFCAYNIVRKLLGEKDDAEIIKQVKAGNQSAIPGFVRASIALGNISADINRFVSAIKDIAK